MLEIKLVSKIAALKSHLLNDICDLRNEIILLKENNEKEKLADSNNKKDEVLLLKEKINSNLLNHQCCRVSENANNEIYQKSSENEEKKLKKYPDKNKIEITPVLLLGSKMINAVKSKIETR